MNKVHGKNLKSYLVFLSSPDGMEEERGAVRDFIKSENQILEKKGNRLDLVEFGDSRISTASLGNPIGNIIESLNHQKDSFLLYIGLMGERFGSSTGEDSTKKEYSSGTDAEFRESLRIRQEQGKGFPEIKFFFKRISQISQRDGEDPDSYLERIVQFARVIEFQKEVEKEFTVGTFSSSHELSKRLNEDVAPWVHDKLPVESDPESTIRLEVPNIQNVQSSPFVQYAPVLTCFVDPKITKEGDHIWEFTEINDRMWKETLDYENKQAIDERVRQLVSKGPEKDKDLGLLHLIHPDDREKTKAQMSLLLNGGRQRDFVNRYIHRSYSYRWIRWASNVIKNEERSLVYSLGVDVTSHYVKSELYDGLTSAGRASDENDELPKTLAGVLWDIMDYDIILINPFPKDDSEAGDNILISRDESGTDPEAFIETDIPGDIYSQRAFRSNADQHISRLLSAEKRQTSSILSNLPDTSSVLYVSIPSDPFSFTLCLFRKNPPEAIERPFEEEDIRVIETLELETYLNALQRKRLSKSMRNIFQML